PAGAIIPDVAALNPILARLCPKCKPLPKTLPGPFLDLWTMACTSIGQPPESPSAPGVGPAELGPWMPLVPPAAEREIVLPVSELVPGAALALARQKGTTFTGLNAHSSAKRALPIVPALPNEATSTGAGELADRGAPPEATNYRVAQADWFGRWSPFATRAAGAGVRPLPPRPAVSATYLQATGQIRVRVPLPPTDTLAHGSRLLAALEVKLDLGATQPLTSTPVPAGEPPEVEVLLAGPALGVAQTAVVPVTARWVDTAGQKSPESEVVVVQLADPRPPPAPAFAQPFLYTSRPDVTGRARVDLAWTPAVTHAGSRVFYTDETRLTGRLAALGSQGAPILAAVNTAPDVAARAQVFTDHADLFTRDLFEQLTPQPIRPATGTTQARFQHAVSGSLRILSFYRVVAVSAANIEVPFGSSPLLAVAVPNTAPPSQPLLSAEPLADGPTSSPFRARLKVRMPRGQVPAAEYRLRRTLGSATDLLAMPVVGTGTLPPPNGEPQEVVVFDAGGSEIDPAGAIQPWLTYSWRVEVRGAAEPGGPSGRWGTPSVPASATFVPPGPPEEAVNVTATRLSDGSAEVLWEHPSPLTGGPAGPYRLDVYRQRPGKREERAASISADAGPTAGGRNPDRTGPFHYLDPADQSPAGTCYRVIVLDPIGRPSRPSATATV
ncbi:MAG TPA: hypothetical protein VKE74_32290, partial [Gemmataceae bacterium]|nr:hypothetical protein [Gemmataceae bacterium]